MQNLSIPNGFDFEKVSGLSIEIRQKLRKAKPQTLAEAAKVSGVTPAALSAILYSLRRKGKSSAIRSI